MSGGLREINPLNVICSPESVEASPAVSEKNYNHSCGSAQSHGYRGLPYAVSTTSSFSNQIVYYHVKLMLVCTFQNVKISVLKSFKYNVKLMCSNC